jgi:hypothetical protein
LAAKPIAFPATTLAQGAGYTLRVTLRTFVFSTKFASSNIYWDGTKLTFAPYTSSSTDYAAMPDRYYQGVYFQWGSLIGISAKDSFSALATIYRYDTGDKKWKEETTSASWADICFYNNVPLAGNSAENFFIKNNIIDNDNGNNAGDICRFISSVTSDPALMGYRMPTLDELGSSWSTTYGNSTWNAVTPTDVGGKNTINQGRNHSTTGIGFPASGVHRDADGLLLQIGTSGRYWSGSASLNGSIIFRYLYFISSGAPVETHTARAALSVRCVLN